jgi:NAD(P)-dependent dehydrogenase (short-subunit alcohol dehydrogenase family)
MIDPTGKKALVTGGARRVGAAMVSALASCGVDVAIHHRGSDADADALAQQCRERGVNAVVFKADLAEPGAAEHLAARAEEALGGVDILINSASTWESAPFDQVDRAMWDRALATNLTGPMFLSQALGARMAARGFGRIVNIGDVAGLRPWAHRAPHSVSKAGLVMLTRILAQAYAPHVLTNAVIPGPVLMPDGTGEQVEANVAAETVLGRVGTPGDVVDAMLYLVSAEYVTGQCLTVDGGQAERT